MSATRRPPWAGLAFVLGLGATFRGPSPAAVQSVSSDATDYARKMEAFLRSVGMPLRA